MAPDLPIDHIPRKAKLGIVLVAGILCWPAISDLSGMVWNDPASIFGIILLLPFAVAWAVYCVVSWQGVAMSELYCHGCEEVKRKVGIRYADWKTGSVDRMQVEHEDSSDAEFECLECGDSIEDY